jgi:hypothetical protein
MGYRNTMKKGFPVHTPSLVGAGSPWHTVSIFDLFFFPLFFVSKLAKKTVFKILDQQV